MNTYLLNNEKNGVEIYFQQKPERAILSNLSTNGFRWHNIKKCWYAKQTEERIKLVEQLVNGIIKEEIPKDEAKEIIEVGYKKEPRFNYTDGAWEGINYDIKLQLKEIAKLIKNQLKIDYPKAVFSITTKHYSGGKSMDIILIADVENPYIDGLPTHGSINQYNIDHNNKLTDRAKQMFKRIKSLADSFNFDDSDSQTDYFHTNFYWDLNIGQWNKDFKLIKES